MTDIGEVASVLSKDVERIKVKLTFLHHSSPIPSVDFFLYTHTFLKCWEMILFANWQLLYQGEHKPQFQRRWKQRVNVYVHSWIETDYKHLWIKTVRNIFV